MWYTEQRLLMATFVCLCVCLCCSLMTDVFLTGLMETTSATAHSYTHKPFGRVYKPSSPEG